MFALLLTGLMLPQQTVLIPLYEILRSLHLLDTRIGLIIVHGVYGMPAQILILRGFMTAIPREIEKAAQIEGRHRFPDIHKDYPAAFASGDHRRIHAELHRDLEGIRFRPGLSQQREQLPGHRRHAQVEQRSLYYGVQPAAAGLVISQIPIVILFILTYRQISSGNFVGSVKG